MAPELSNARKFVLDFSRDQAELDLAENGASQAIVDRYTAAVQKFDLSILDLSPADRSSIGNKICSTSSFDGKVKSKVVAQPKLVFKVDCYSFAIVLWVLLGWELPYREITAIQILIAVAYHCKRPSTKKIVAAGWPEPVINLMRRLWSVAPEDRPSMTE